MGLCVADIFFSISNARGVLNIFTCIEQRVWASIGHPSPMLCGKKPNLLRQTFMLFSFLIETTTVIPAKPCGKNQTPYSPSVLKCDQRVNSNTENW